MDVKACLFNSGINDVPAGATQVEGQWPVGEGDWNLESRGAGGVVLTEEAGWPLDDHRRN